MDNSGAQRDWGRDQLFPVNFFVELLSPALSLHSSHQPYDYFKNIISWQWIIQVVTFILTKCCWTRVIEQDL